MSEHKQGTIQVDTDLVRQLAELLDATSLTEIEVQDGERRIRIVRQVTMAAAPASSSWRALPRLLDKGEAEGTSGFFSLSPT